MTTAPRRLGRYELRHQVGRGNVGEVWQAYDLQEHRDVAVKIIHTDLQSDPQFLSRFTQEGHHLTALHHANIIQVRDVAISRPSPADSSISAYIVSAYITGQTLADYIAKTSHKGSFPSPAEIVYLFTSLGVAIDYAHQQGVIHGNIKPSNILLDRANTSHFSEGEPMLSDFGLTQLIGDTSSSPSPAYISPEQAKGEPANNRSDIYALGVLLYELCTGVQPFRDSSSVAVMMNHINTLPTPPILINPAIPPVLSEVILRAMAKDTATRFSLASLLGAAVADAYAIQSTITLPRIAAEQAGEDAQQTTQGQHITLLGISQSFPKLPPRTTDTQRITPSRPMPAISRPLPAVSGQYPLIQPAAQVPATHATGTGNGAFASSPNNPHTAALSPHSAKIPIASGTSSPIPVTSLMNTTTTPMHVPASTQTVRPPHSPYPPHTPVPTAQRSEQRRNIPVYTIIALLTLLLLVVLGSIGVNLFLHRPIQAGTTVGHIFFQDDALGHDDLLRIELQNVPAPASGQQQVAWLQEKGHLTLRLGTLNVQNDSASLQYAGDAHHTNLLSVIQRVVVTTENSGTSSSSPKGPILYTAQFDATWLPYLKNILYLTPNLPPNSGVVTETIDALKSIDDKASSIVDSLRSTHDYGLARRQATRIIEILDNTHYAVSSGDQPATIPSTLSVPVGLFSSPTQTGYLDALSAQLDKLQQNASNSATLQEHVQHVRNAISDLKDWLQKLRAYDVLLVKAASLNDPALVGVALQLKQIAADSYTGRTVPPNNGPQPIAGSAGAYQAYVECQYMATLDIIQV